MKLARSSPFRFVERRRRREPRTERHLVQQEEIRSLSRNQSRKAVPIRGARHQLRGTFADADLEPGHSLEYSGLIALSPHLRPQAAGPGQGLGAISDEVRGLR